MNYTSSRTKIIATLGPATSTQEMISKLIDEGVDVFRLNFSHSKQEEHLSLINIIKDINQKKNTHTAILADLQGPKLRVGEIENNKLELKEGDVVTFVTEKCIGTKERIYMSYQEFAYDVSVGEAILIDDGKIKLEVVETNKKDTVKAKVLYGGILSSKKGVNLPNTKVSLPSLTDEDISNANFALDNDVDWIALSFVRKASDVIDLKELIRKKKGHAGVIAKVEKPEALKEIDEIIDLADAVMIARGDLGVEVSFHEVPLIQKKIVEKCLIHSKPVIIATQILESMITNFRPTRAEANDVANAVLDGADALMLSGETSVGKYPVEAIQCMQQIINYTETNGNPSYKMHEPNPGVPTFVPNSICYNAARIANQLKPRAIVTFTNSGYTAFRISSHRPVTKIIAFTTNQKLLRKTSLVWGVEAYYMEFEQIDKAINESTDILKDNKEVTEGDLLVYVGSIPLHLHGRTNMLKLGLV
jgi:pyruvate kinase